MRLYCADRSNSLSPATVRKMDSIKKNHFPELMTRRIDQISDRQWQQAVNAMLASHAVKTVKVSLGLVKTVVTDAGVKFPDVSIGKASAAKAKAMDKCQFLEPEQIPAFVQEAAKTQYAVPLLLALSSLRIAEIDGLLWQDITQECSGVQGASKPSTVKIRRVRIKDKDNNWVVKDGAKNETSVRDVLVLIPELQAALNESRGQPDEKVMTCCQDALRRNLEKICKRAGVPNPGVHGLRHTFVSLSAHLGIPEIVSQEIGGWANDRIMKEIYTHVARSDVSASLAKLQAFYAPNANEYANANNSP